MALTKLSCMYGHLEGIDGKFARDVTGYLSIADGIYEKHGLDISWNHVQGTEERYRRLENGEAQLSFVVGRASLQHFLDTKTTRVIGCAMNSCPYLLVADGAIKEIKDLKGQTVVCRDGPARGVPLGWQFQQYGGGEQPYWVIDTGEGAIGNVAGQAGLGINGGLTQRQGPTWIWRSVVSVPSGL